MCRFKISVCRFKTSPCVGSKRLLVYRQNARMSLTCARFAGTHARRRFELTHGDVWNLHTGTFGTYTRLVFRVPSRATHTTHTPHTLSAHTSHTFSTPHAQPFQHTRTTHDTTHTHTHTHTTPHTTHITHLTHTNALDTCTIDNRP